MAKLPLSDAPLAEVKNAMDGIRKRQEKIREGIKATKESIRRGARRAKDPECPEEILWDEDKLRLLAREPDLKRQAELWERVMSEIVWGVKA